MVGEKAREFQGILEKEFAGNPYGVEMNFDIWGIDWSMMTLGSRLYYFIRQFPELESVRRMGGVLPQQSEIMAQVLGKKEVRA